MRTSIDAGKLVNLVRGPGIDTRLWIALAVVQNVEVVTGKNSGIYVDVQALPYKEEYTAWVGSAYAASQAGLYFPLKVRDLVLIALPNGDPAAGVVVLARFNNGTRPVPAEFMTEDGAPSPHIVLVGEEDVHIQIFTKGGGETQIVAQGDGSIRVTTEGNGAIVLTPEGTGKVGLGAEPGAAGMEPVAMGTKTDTNFTDLESYVVAELAELALKLNPVFTALTLPPYVPGLAPTLVGVGADKAEVK